jgi:Fe2+ or Zn2+ uptake regulation protein
MNAKHHDGASMRRRHKQPRTLSAHELAMLLRLSDSSAETNAVTPDVIALQEAGLVHVIESEDGDATCALSVDGKVLLRLLGADAAAPYRN